MNSQLAAFLGDETYGSGAPPSYAEPYGNSSTSQPFDEPSPGDCPARQWGHLLEYKLTCYPCLYAYRAFIVKTTDISGCRYTGALAMEAVYKSVALMSFMLITMVFFMMTYKDSGVAEGINVRLVIYTDASQALMAWALFLGSTTSTNHEMQNYKCTYSMAAWYTGISLLYIGHTLNFQSKKVNQFIENYKKFYGILNYFIDQTIQLVALLVLSLVTMSILEVLFGRFHSINSFTELNIKCRTQNLSKFFMDLIICITLLLFVPTPVYPKHSSASIVYKSFASTTIRLHKTVWLVYVPCSLLLSEASSTRLWSLQIMTCMVISIRYHDLPILMEICSEVFSQNKYTSQLRYFKADMLYVSNNRAKIDDAEIVYYDNSLELIEDDALRQTKNKSPTKLLVKEIDIKTLISDLNGETSVYPRHNELPQV